MRARSVGEARAAARNHLAPSLNVTLADTTSVAMQMAGAAPRRQPATPARAASRRRGGSRSTTGKECATSTRTPGWSIPPSGIVVNTNNRISDAAFPDHLSFDWGDAFRIVRAGRLLGDRQYHTLDSFIEIQTDAVAEDARVLLPLIARDLWYSGEPAAAGSAERQRQEVLERLAAWNGEMSEHTPEPLIYAAWVRALKRRLTQDELGPLVALVPGPSRSSSSGSIATSTAPRPGATSARPRRRRAAPTWRGWRSTMLWSSSASASGRGSRAGAGATRIRRCICTRPSATCRC